MAKRQTAGEKALKAASDTTKYDSMEMAHGLTESIVANLIECTQKHDSIFAEEEYCVVLQLANDPLIQNLKRRKFYGWPYLPKPRPNQAVFLYNKITGDIKRLWVLPEAETMIALYRKTNVYDCWKTMRLWSEAFFDGCFWETIRKQHDISMLSESEYLDAHREELVKAMGKDVESSSSESFDFGKVMSYEVVCPDQSLSEQDILNSGRQA